MTFWAFYLQQWQESITIIISACMAIAGAELLHELDYDISMQDMEAD